MIARFEGGAPCPDLLHDADTLMPQYPARLAAGHIALENVQIGAADRGFGDFHDGVIRSVQDGLGTFFQGFEAGTTVSQGFHGRNPE